MQAFVIQPVKILFMYLASGVGVRVGCGANGHCACVKIKRVA